MARILVIDDESDLRTLIEQTLRAAGHDVAAAANGRQGLAMHSASPFAVVITDIFMPEKDGLEVIRDLRRDSPPVQIIAMSGRPDTANALYLAQRFGAYRVLVKPFAPDELLSVIADTLRVAP